MASLLPFQINETKAVPRSRGDMSPVPGMRFHWEAHHTVAVLGRGEMSVTPAALPVGCLDGDLVYTVPCVPDPSTLASPGCPYLWPVP